jgi:hypothetical protein
MFSASIVFRKLIRYVLANFGARERERGGEGGREREGAREGGSEGGRERGREGGREGGFEQPWTLVVPCSDGEKRVAL